jgi:hypothetical protein
LIGAALRLSTSAPDDVESAATERLKQEFIDLSSEASRGFKATPAQRERAKKILEDLSRRNPTPDPARDYFSPSPPAGYEPNSGSPSLSGKWTLIYTDAPDILGLGTAPSFGLAAADLGRIGQECDPPFVKNVIEWKKPAWTNDVLNFLPLSANVRNLLPPRLLQRVITRASASPDQPLRVRLGVAGLQVSFDEEPRSPASGEGGADRSSEVRARGFVGSFLPGSLVDWLGRPGWTLPFGEFTVLYLDEQLRAIRTNQGYIAVNLRIRSAQDAWF